MTAPDWRERIEEMSAAWSVIAGTNAGPPIDQWPTEFSRIRAHYSRLVGEGKWTSGPIDLMSVLDATDDELSHSRVLAWILNPTGRHGLGSYVLRRILRAGWPNLPVPDLGMAVVRREVPLGTTRADVVVTVGATILVIENKVWASESEEQCEAQYQYWHAEADDVRFLFLTRTGYLPLSAVSAEAQAAWRAMSYRQLAGLLDDWLDVTGVTDAASMAIPQYRAALDRLVGPAATFAITTRGQT